MLGRSNISDVKSTTVFTFLKKINPQMVQLVVCAKHRVCFIADLQVEKRVETLVMIDRICRTWWEGVVGNVGAF